MLAFVSRRELLPAAASVLLMLSGGPDSMALLDLMCLCDRRLRLGLRLGALHADYGMRGAESDHDRMVVERACAAAGVPLEVVRPSPHLRAPDFQEKARRLRLGAARRLLDRQGYDLVATGHNLDDQAETILYRLAKYPSPRALVGMSPRDGRLVRPLLCLRAADIRAYCRRRGIDHGDDRTNSEETYARNVIRLAVLPQLERLNPSVAESLAAAAEIAREQQELLDALADESWAAVTAAGVSNGPHGGEDRGRQTTGGPHADEPAGVDLRAFSALPAALQALVARRLAGGALGRDALIGRRLTRCLRDLGSGRSDTRRVSLRGGWEAVREHDRLSVRRSAPAHCCVPRRCVLPAPGAGPAVVTFCGRTLTIEQVRGALPVEAAMGSDTVVLGLAAPATALTLRHPATGDRLCPRGLGAETSLARFLGAQKVPRDERPRCLVVELDDAIAWVEVPHADAGSGRRSPPGLRGRVAETCRVTHSNAFTLRVCERPAAAGHAGRPEPVLPDDEDRIRGDAPGGGDRPR